jgi:hypothetical protein
MRFAAGATVRCITGTPDMEIGGLTEGQSYEITRVAHGSARIEVVDDAGHRCLYPVHHFLRPAA